MVFCLYYLQGHSDYRQVPDSHQEKGEPIAYLKHSQSNHLIHRLIVGHEEQTYVKAY